MSIRKIISSEVCKWEEVVQEVEAEDIVEEVALEALEAIGIVAPLGQDGVVI